MLAAVIAGRIRGASWEPSVNFLAFHPVHADLANKMALAVTAHATPVGSGTVARTKRIPVERMKPP